MPLRASFQRGLEPGALRIEFDVAVRGRDVPDAPGRDPDAVRDERGRQSCIAENAGGYLGPNAAVGTVTILGR